MPQARAKAPVYKEAVDVLRDGIVAVTISQAVELADRLLKPIGKRKR